MFEKIVIRKARDDNLAFDAGALAEALLFYRNVHLILDGGSLGALARIIGLDILCGLIDDGYLKATFFRDQLGVVTNNNGGLSYHGVTTTSLVGHRDHRGEFDDEQMISKFLKNAAESDADQTLVKKLLDRMPLRKLGELGTPENRISRAIDSDLANSELLKKSATLFIQTLVPEFTLPNEIVFSLYPTKKGLIISSNIDFRAVNELYH